MRGKKEKIRSFKFILIMSLSLVLLVGCSKDKVKDPYDIKDAEIGKFNDSGYESQTIKEGDLTHLKDAFIKKYASRLINLDYEIIDIEEIKVEGIESIYGEVEMFTIHLKDYPELVIYKFNKDSDEFQRVKTSGSLIPLSNLGSQSNAVVFDIYALDTATAIDDAIETFKGMGK